MVYLIHFNEKISDNHTCQHYVGYAEKNLLGRIFAHQTGHGARLTQVAIERGIGFKLVRAWQGSRQDERKLKSQKNAPRFCPVCNARPLDLTLEEIDLIGDEPAF